MTEVLNLKESNKKIIELIESGEPFSVVRLGDNISSISMDYNNYGKLNLRYLHPTLKTLYHDGIYTRNKDLSKIVLFIKFYNNAIKNSDIMAAFPSLYSSRQNHYINLYSLPKPIYNRVLEPFYVALENEKPWTQYLYGKKILIINPFVDSIKKQMESGFSLFKDQDKRLFMEGQEFVYYKSYQTIAGNHIHNDWFETFSIMCKDIAELDFDIALLGCGGYGLPLCNYIKTKLNKSAIYVGGGLQLLFGVIGKRWARHKEINQIISENGCEFIRPSKEEQCSNLQTIEGGCYW